MRIDIPNPLYIGAMPYEILKTKDDIKIDGIYVKGLCQNANLKLWVSTNQPTPLQDLTLWHEITHAIDCRYGGRVCMTDGKVEAVAQGYLQIFQQLGIKFKF